MVNLNKRIEEELYELNTNCWDSKSRSFLIRENVEKYKARVEKVKKQGYSVERHSRLADIYLRMLDVQTRTITN